MRKFGADYQLLEEGIAATDEPVGSSRRQLQKQAKSIMPFQPNVVFVFALQDIKEIWFDTGRLG
jgi:hypothetical protein